jgi:hypothetical protein
VILPETIELTKSCRRRTSPDDSIVFSLDFPITNPKDSFRIDYEGDHLLFDKKRLRSERQNPSLAITVSSNAVRDIAVLGRDGKLSTLTVSHCEVVSGFRGTGPQPKK